MIHEKNLIKLIIATPIFFIVITVLSISYYQIQNIENQFNEETKKFQKNYVKDQKILIQEKISDIRNTVEFQKEEIKKGLKNSVDKAYYLAMNIYNENIGVLSDKEIEKKIIETLRKIRIGKNGYYFIQYLKNENEIVAKLLPATPGKEGTNRIDTKDADGKLFVQEFRKVARSQEAGFIKYRWYKLTNKKQKQFNKISYIKLFKPFDWIIGYGVYFDKHSREEKERILKWLNSIKYGNRGFIWTYSGDGKLLEDPYCKGKDSCNEYKESSIVQRFIKEAKENSKGTFVDYISSSGERKIAYVAYIKDWDWIIGTEIFFSEINKKLEAFHIEKQKKIEKESINSIVIALIFIFFASIVSFIISRQIGTKFYKYQKNIKKQNRELLKINETLKEKVEEKTKDLKDLNNKLQEKVEEEVSKNREKDALIIQQSKMAALGEMIGNISHQWRQPLNALGLYLQHLEESIEYGEIDKNYVKKMVASSMEKIAYMSKTIDDFRNFFKPGKKKEQFSLAQSVAKSVNIVSAALKNNYIDIKIIKKSDFETEGFEGEFSQMVINMLNNSKDAILQNGIKEGKIEVTIDGENRKLIIADNGGGIPEEILEKIFEPYFTTKFKAQGTGIGLYMSKMIVEENMHGRIKAFNGKEGAVFEIIF